MKQQPEKQGLKMEAVQRLTSAEEMFERALEGSLSDEEVVHSASAVVDAALLGELSDANGVDRPGAGLYFREPLTAERRDKLIRSLVNHPERTRRLFRS